MGPRNSSSDAEMSEGSAGVNQSPSPNIPSAHALRHPSHVVMDMTDYREDDNEGKISTIKEMYGLFAISFSYGFVFNSLQSIVVPQEIQRLVGTHQSMWLGLVMATGAICQLSAPIVGSWSDKTGKRMPFLIHGSILTIVGVTLFLFIRYIYSIFMLIIAFMISTVGLSIQYAILTSLLSDCVPEEQLGTGSSVIAMLAMLGSGFGYSMFAFRIPTSASYFGYMISIVVCLFISLMFTPKSDRVGLRSSKSKVKHNWLWEVVSSLIPPNPHKYPDFLWACAGRCLFNGGLSAQVYLVYYFRDVVQIGDPGQVMSYVAVMALLGGILVAIPSGLTADRFGKKPIVYASVSITIFCLGAFMVATNFVQILIIGMLFGMGNVSYLSVDYAIGVQTLPKDESSVNFIEMHPMNRRKDSQSQRKQASDAAKDLGLFAMSATFGQLIGQLIYGLVLHFSEVTNESGNTSYRHSGYITLYSCGAFLFMLSGLSTKFIQDIK